MVVLGLALILLPRFLRSRNPATALGLWQMTFRAAGKFPADTSGAAGSLIGSSPPDSSRIARALALVPDAELGLSIVELGLVESVATDDSGRVRVVLVLTTPACPYGADIARAALDAVVSVPGVRSAEVRIDPKAVWDPARASEDARRRLNLLPRP